MHPKNKSPKQKLVSTNDLSFFKMFCNSTRYITVLELPHRLKDKTTFVRQSKLHKDQMKTQHFNRYLLLLEISFTTFLFFVLFRCNFNLIDEQRLLYLGTTTRQFQINCCILSRVVKCIKESEIYDSNHTTNELCIASIPSKCLDKYYIISPQTFLYSYI